MRAATRIGCGAVSDRTGHRYGVRWRPIGRCSDRWPYLRSRLAEHDGDHFFRPRNGHLERASNSEPTAPNNGSIGPPTSDALRPPHSQSLTPEGDR